MTNTCPNCGSIAEIERMGDEEILKCSTCGYERSLTREEILPVEKKLVAGSLVLAVILLFILWYISQALIAHV